MTRSILIKDATIVSLDRDRGAEPFTGDVLLEHDRIVQVGGRVEPRREATVERVIDGRRRLAIPGLVNAHLHSFAAFQRGRYDNLPLELWMLYAYPFLGLAPMSERLIYLRTLLVGMESLKSGVTCIVDDVLELPTQTLGSLRTVFGAYEELGVRANCSGHMIDRRYTDTLPYANELLPPRLLQIIEASPPPSTETFLEFCADAISEFHSPGGLTRYVIAPSGPQRCTDELLIRASEIAKTHDVAYHLHVLETKVQLVTGHEFYGKSLVRHMQDLGVLTEQTTLAHAIWVTDEDIELIADAGSSVAHNATSNLRTGAGVVPWRKLMDAGINIALGTDGIASNGSARLFDVIRAAALLHKVASPNYGEWPTAGEILYAATIGGARSARLDHQIGSLEAGKKADLVLLDLDTYNFTPLNDPRLHLVYSENGASVDIVIVNGEIVVDGGRLTRVDEEAVLSDFRQAIPAYLARYAKAEEINHQYAPYYAEIYRRCHSESMEMNRFIEDESGWVTNSRLGRQVRGSLVKRQTSHSTEPPAESQ